MTNHKQMNHESFDDILQLVEKTLTDILAATEVPARGTMWLG